MTRAALLDVNVLVALFDPAHVNHEAAHAWFARERKIGWATCALTQNGLIRVLSNPAYPQGPMRAADAANHLREFMASGQHVSWPMTISMTDERRFALQHVVGHRQLTDVYLLGLAVGQGGRLATFDRSIPLLAVHGAHADHVLLIPA